MARLKRRSAAEPTKAFAALVSRTARLNAVAVIGNSIGGLVLAATVSPTVRGQYAAVQSWFWLSLVLGEVGVSSALTFYVARDPMASAVWRRAAQRMLLVTGSATCVLGLLLAGPLSRGHDDLRLAYMVIFVLVPIAMVLGTYTFQLQGTSIRQWNRARTIQPLLYVVGILCVVGSHSATLLSAVAVLAGSTIFQGLLARRMVSTRARIALTSPSPARPIRLLLRYGLMSVGGSAPALVSTRVDQVFLSASARLSDLGQYAVAVSLSGLVLPIVAALGQVAFPRLASLGAADGAEISTLIRRVRFGSWSMATLLCAPIYVGTAFVVVPILGPEYGKVPRLVLYLLPGAVALAAGNALSDVIRGLGRPGSVALAQVVGAALTIVGLTVFVPTHGVDAAALVSTSAYAVTWLITLAIVSRLEVRSQPRMDGALE